MISLHINRRTGLQFYPNLHINLGTDTKGSNVPRNVSFNTENQYISTYPADERQYSRYTSTEHTTMQTLYGIPRDTKRPRKTFIDTRPRLRVEGSSGR